MGLTADRRARAAGRADEARLVTLGALCEDRGAVRHGVDVVAVPHTLTPSQLVTLHPPTLPRCERGYSVRTFTGARALRPHLHLTDQFKHLSEILDLSQSDIVNLLQLLSVLFEKVVLESA
jgi:hypothetical protein